MDEQGTRESGIADARETRGRMKTAALRRLARREYSRAELTRKLSADFVQDAVPVAQVLDELAAAGAQSDARVAESQVASGVRRGHGPLRICRELAERGIDTDLVQHALAAAAVDWPALAAQVCARKFGDNPADDWSERARRARFLQYRGFGADAIEAALRRGNGDGGGQAR
jgi:regulatory protein